MKWLLLGALVVLLAVTWALHGPWMDRYRGATGSSCCGVADCIAVEAWLVADRGKRWLAEVNGRHMDLPKGSVHLSEEPVAYWCHTGHPQCAPPRLDIRTECGRCLFVAVGG